MLTKIHVQTAFPATMSSNSAIRDPDPLHPDTVPEELVNREEEQSVVEDALFGDGVSKNLFLTGPRGTGKTMLARFVAQSPKTMVKTCYVPCVQYDTEYKALLGLYWCVTGEDFGTGFSVSDLQREFKQRSDQLHTIIVLDQIEFLPPSDRDNLLYYLSRLEHSDQVNIIVISDHYDDLSSLIEKRAYSSLQPSNIQFERYSVEEAAQILGQRASEALNPGSFDEEALDSIASATQNLTLGLIWLGVAAESQERVTEKVVRRVESEAHQRYIDFLLQDFSIHHRLLFRAVRELADEDSVRTGEVQNRYYELSQKRNLEELSERRLADFLTHLELLDLISAEYHYGGNKGKTREFKIGDTVA